MRGRHVEVESDITCGVSGYIDGVKSAYLVPEDELVWFIITG
jgi:hypothetical protein